MTANPAAPVLVKDERFLRGDKAREVVAGGTVIPMSSRILLAMVCLTVALKLPAQQVAPAPTPEPSQYDKLWDWIYDGTHQDAQHLTQLGVDKQTAENFTAQDDKYASVEPIRLKSKENIATLFLPCTAGEDENAHLYVMAYDNKSWKISDKAELDCHYDMSVSVEIKQIRSPSFDEVLIHHVCEGHGTGFLEQDFEVYAVANGKLVPELKAEEVLDANPVLVAHPRDIDQQSDFVIVPIRNSQVRAIEETRSKVLNGSLAVYRRIFRWDAAKSSYLPSKFIRVIATAQ